MTTESKYKVRIAELLDHRAILLNLRDVPLQTEPFDSYEDALGFVEWAADSCLYLHDWCRLHQLQAQWRTERDWPECTDPECTSRTPHGGRCVSCVEDDRYQAARAEAI